MMKVGIAGIGFMGWIHYLAYQKVAGIELAAICTRDPKKRAGDWTGIKGNFGPPGEQVDLSGLKAYDDVEKLLADPEIDLIDICLPPDLHADVACRALAAGKHVLCEKPMALTTDDCDRMVAAAKQHGKQLMVAHVLPFFPEYAFALKAIREKTYGDVLGGWFKRVISEPEWIPDFFNADKVGGPLVDLHVHDAHFIRLAFGMPNSVSSSGRMRGDVVEYCHSLFHYDQPSYAVAATSGVIQQQGRSFTHGFELHFERATLQFEFAVLGEEPRSLLPLTLLDNKGAVTTVELDEGDAFALEITAAVQAIESGTPSPILGGGYARDAILLCHQQTAAVREGK